MHAKGQAALEVALKKAATTRPLRGQAALDFLMTYGWALLLISLVVGALVAINIFDVGSYFGSRSYGFSQINPTGWQLSQSGPNLALRLKLKNNAGVDVNITSINATLLNKNANYSIVTKIKFGKEAEISPITFNGLTFSPGSSYTINLRINYTDVESASSYGYVEAGTITGKLT